MSKLMTVAEVQALIAGGKSLALAGEESLLDQLPRGNWVAGTIPYFIAEDGGVSTKERIFVTELPEQARIASIKAYAKDELVNIVKDGEGCGFSMIIVPAGSDVHQAYAKEAPGYPGLFLRPIIGWVSGVDLADLGRKTPKVYNGSLGQKSDREVVAMHVGLPENQMPSIDIINLFSQGDGDTIVFEEDGFAAKAALINGEKVSLAGYLKDRQVDTKLPLVADYNGAMINVSFQGVDEDSGTVNFYAPVFGGIEYRVAKPVQDYVTEFGTLIPEGQMDVVFSCNCILNYLYSSLEGCKTGPFTGPITFGEIAYQLLNQTLTYLTVESR